MEENGRGFVLPQERLRDIATQREIVDALRAEGYKITNHDDGWAIPTNDSSSLRLGIGSLRVIVYDRDAEMIKVVEELKGPNGLLGFEEESRNYSFDKGEKPTILSHLKEKGYKLRENGETFDIYDPRKVALDNEGLVANNGFVGTVWYNRIETDRSPELDKALEELC